MELEIHDSNVDLLIELDREANGPRLRVEDRTSGRVTYLDPLEIECLTRVPEGRLGDFVTD